MSNIRILLLLLGCWFPQTRPIRGTGTMIGSVRNHGAIYGELGDCSLTKKLDFFGYQQLWFMVHQGMTNQEVGFRVQLLLINSEKMS